MTISATEVKTPTYIPDGVTTTFPVTFYSASVDEIDVVKDGAIVNPSLYTFNRDADGTGDVVFTVAPTGSQLFIRSVPEFTQEADFMRWAPFFPDQFNAMLDRMAARDIYLKDLIGRAPVVASDRNGLNIGRTVTDKVLGVTNGNLVLISTSALGGGGIPTVGVNALDIGLFEDAANADIPATAMRVKVGDRGGMEMRYSEEVDEAFVATYPRFSFIDGNGRGFMCDETTPNMLNAGGVDQTGTPKLADEVVYDNSDAVEALIDWVLSRPEHLTIDFSGHGWGVTRTVEFVSPNQGSWWNSRVLRIIAGRFVAMAPMEDILVMHGKSFDVIGVWQLWGGTDAQVNVGYSSMYAKNGMRIKNSGSSNLGFVAAQGVRRYAVQTDETLDASQNNNIPLRIEGIMASVCGSYGGATVATADQGFGGTYSAGSWEDCPANNGSVNQTSIVTLTPAAGVDVDDLQVNDAIRFNGDSDTGATCHSVKEIVSTTATTVTVRVFPYIEIEDTGTFVSMHGGAFSGAGLNLANTQIGIVYNYVGATALQIVCEYAPTINTLLAESSEVCIQVGGGALLGAHIEGLNINQYHFENIIWTLLDFASASTGMRLGSVSNLQGNSIGKFAYMRRIEAGFATGTGGTWQAYTNKTLAGWEIRVHGGVIHTGVSVEASAEGLASFGLGNQPEWANPGPHKQNAATITLLTDATMARLARGQRECRVLVHGTGTSGAPTGDTTITLDGSSVSQGITINGGTTDVVIPTGTGALDIKCFLEPNMTTGLGNWRVGHTRVLLS